MTQIQRPTGVQIHLTLSNYVTESGLTIQSCLVAGLRDARKCTGRNIETGQPDPSNTCGNLGSWTGAMCYLTILDQIGTCYRPISRTVILGESRAIIKALKYFSDLSDIEIKAIYALRNAFFHDFSLYNRHTTDPYLQRTFTVDNHPTNNIVVLPSTNWDGEMSSRNAQNNTYINLKALGDLVENIYSQLIAIESTDSLSLDLPGGESELLDRYTFAHQ